MNKVHPFGCLAMFGICSGLCPCLFVLSAFGITKTSVHWCVALAKEVVNLRLHSAHWKIWKVVRLGSVMACNVK